MDFQVSRLRRGEVITGIAAAVLVVVLLALPWYGLGGRLGSTAAALGAPTSLNGWQGLPTLRWLILVTILAALALTWFQGARRAPALPASLSVIVLVLSVLTVLGLIYRVLISVPGPDSLGEAKAGSYLGLASALVMVYGAFRSLREEDPPDPERNARIPVIELGRRR
jgi:hypothetical protein